ncbi:MAG TPA: dienelactone hydrolase family protein [Allosphingosinicella sp.]|nr:dienelactone hydrolase family protein [Allosphingosinicella sp.]
MKTETLNYDADVPMVGTLFRPDGAEAAPAILVFSDIMGIGDHSRERAARLAERGYVAFAADLHGNGQILPAEQALEQLERFYANPDVTCGRGEAALAQLQGVPGVDATRIAAMGFCYGGTLSFEMARRGAPLSASIGFHAGLATSNPNGGASIKGKVLACIGSEDPAVPPEQRAAFEAEMRAAGVDWQLHLYGGVYHSFTDWRCDAAGLPEFARYNAAADQRSWAAMCGLLDEVFDREAGEG